MPVAQRVPPAVGSVVQRLLRAYRRLGVLGLVRHLFVLVRYSRERRRALAAERRFDEQYGVETAGIVRLTSLEIASANKVHGVRYQASEPGEFGALLDGLELDPAAYTFVDYGCGKGRVLLLAAERGFGRVVGVEFSPALCEVARRNLARLPAAVTERSAIEVVEGDATEYDVPEVPVVLYFYNPFGDDVLGRVLDRVLASARAVPRPVYLAFAGHRSALLADRAELVPVVPPGPGGALYCVEAARTR